MPTPTVVLASRNPGKIEEMLGILHGLPCTFTAVAAYPGVADIEEDGRTMEENAYKKAREVFRQTGLPAIGDDSGLEVYRLDMRPGVFSARYAGEHATYAANNEKLLHELDGVPAAEREARFRCVAAYVDGATEKICVGICRGTIIEAPRGRGGFGYDPLFVPRGASLTFAEIALDVKNTISHRAKAFRQMRSFLETRLATSSEPS
jgi:XTP/dITP diphosphohydrolase